MIKVNSNQEINYIRTACKKALLICLKLGEQLKPGISTLDLDGLAKQALLEENCISAALGYRNASGIPFPGNVCISVNSVILHGIPNSNTILQNGDLVKIDVALCHKGYYGDVCRAFTVGESKESRKILKDFTESIVKTACFASRVGNRYKVFSEIISTASKAAGFTVCRDYHGHGVGLQMHMEPVIPFDETCNIIQNIAEGHIFTIEPQIMEGSHYLIVDSDGWTVRSADGRDSCQVEETVLIKRKGFEVLTCL